MIDDVRMRQGPGRVRFPHCTDPGQVYNLESVRSACVVLDVKNEGGFTLGQAEALFEDVYVSIAAHRNYDIHPDGKRFLMIKRSQEDVPTTELIVVENWSEELKRRVPAGKNK